MKISLYAWLHLKQYPENFAFLNLRILELSTRNGMLFMVMLFTDNGFVQFICHKRSFICTNIFSFNRYMFIKNPEDCNLEIFQIRSSKIKFGNIGSKFFIVKSFVVPIIYYLSESRKVRFRKCWKQYGCLVKIISISVCFSGFWNMLFF